MSKFAVEAFTDTLASEMQKFDEKVSVVEPGSFQSDILINARKHMKQTGNTTEGSQYADEMTALMQGPADRSNPAKPTAVAEAVKYSLFDANPKLRYVVVPNEQSATIAIKAALARVVELNQGQAYTYDREKLIKMLDAAMATLSKPAAPK